MSLKSAIFSQEPQTFFVNNSPPLDTDLNSTSLHPTPTEFMEIFQGQAVGFAFFHRSCLVRGWGRGMPLLTLTPYPFLPLSQSCHMRIYLKNLVEMPSFPDVAVSKAIVFCFSRFRTSLLQIKLTLREVTDSKTTACHH